MWNGCHAPWAYRLCVRLRRSEQKNWLSSSCDCWCFAAPTAHEQVWILRKEESPAFTIAHLFQLIDGVTRYSIRIPCLRGTDVQISKFSTVKRILPFNQTASRCMVLTSHTRSKPEIEWVGRAYMYGVLYLPSGDVFPIHEEASLQQLSVCELFSNPILGLTFRKQQQP